MINEGDVVWIKSDVEDSWTSYHEVVVLKTFRDAEYNSRALVFDNNEAGLKVMSIFHLYPTRPDEGYLG